MAAAAARMFSSTGAKILPQLVGGAMFAEFMGVDVNRDGKTGSPVSQLFDSKNMLMILAILIAIIIIINSLRV